MAPVPVPKSTSKADLGFVRRKRMVSWFDPRALIGIAIRDAIAATFGSYADKRDQQASLPLPVDPGFGSRDELWFDLVSDLGEAFDPTYAVAWHVSQPLLDIANTPPLPRGDLLVFMGDEVYPTGSIERYENQSLGPYDAAWPAGHVDDDGPVMLALPGNHDWYDGLTAFLRIYCQRRSIGGWRTHQTRSYFTAELPHRWWIWAIDTQLGGWLDAPQLAYFESQAGLLQPGDRLILITPTPFWVEVPTDTDPTSTVNWFIGRVIPEFVDIKLYASGDWHHYAHYQTNDGSEHRITAGGGGAFLHPTHHLKSFIDIPNPRQRSTSNLELGVTFPSATESWIRTPLVALHAFLNPVFSISLGIVAFALAWLAQSSVRRPDQSVRDAMRSLSWRSTMDALVRSPLALLLMLTIFVAWVAFPRHSEVRKKRTAYFVGFVHGVLQIALVVPVIVWSSHLAPGRGFWFGMAFTAIIVIVGGLAGATLTGLYLLATNIFLGMHDNEAYSALRLRSFKGFLRLHIASDGSLTVYPIGIRRVRSGQWKLNPDASLGSSWFTRPAGVVPELIEAPFVL
jgi:hypothetical protein